MQLSRLRSAERQNYDSVQCHVHDIVLKSVHIKYKGDHCRPIVNVNRMSMSLV